jgi:hypothetical protein
MGLLGDRKDRDCVVICEECGNYFAAEIDLNGHIHALGIPDTECYEGYELQEMEGDIPDAFVDG